MSAAKASEVPEGPLPQTSAEETCPAGQEDPYPFEDAILALFSTPPPSPIPTPEETEARTK
jgi:hypothetical protein